MVLIMEAETIAYAVRLRSKAFTPKNTIDQEVKKLLALSHLEK